MLPFLFGERGGTISFKFLRLWSWTFSKLNFIAYEIDGRENIKLNQSYIYVCNHTSYLDIPGLCLAIPTQFRPLAKIELLKIPIFGWIAQYASITVDRTNKESKAKSLKHLKKILDLGISVFIFPEGRQNRTAKLLQPFYDGAFRIAIETQHPLLPIVVKGAGKLMPPKKYFIQPGKIKIKVLEGIRTDGMAIKDMPVLKSKTRSLMEKELLHMNDI